MAVVNTQIHRSHQRRRGYANEQLAEDRGRPFARACRHGRSRFGRLDRFHLPTGSRQFRDRVSRVLLSCDAITTCAGDVGVYDIASVNSGAVIDADFFASAHRLPRPWSFGYHPRGRRG